MIATEHPAASGQDSGGVRAAVLPRWTAPPTSAHGLLGGVAALSFVLAVPASAQPGCDDWNTTRFFIEAAPETVAACLDAGADVNALTDPDLGSGAGLTPLHLALRVGADRGTITVLLAAGADVHARDVHGATPLHFAARNYRNPTVIAELVEAGADVHARNDRGETPLHIATRNRLEPVAATLVALGADPAAEDHLGRVPRPRVCDWTDYGFFHRASWEAVLGCLEAGADVRARNEFGETPLHLLAADVRTDDYPAARVIGAFVEAGTDPNARDHKGRTPLHVAVGAWRGGTAIAAALLEAGADAVARSDGGFTPLLAAALSMGDGPSRISLLAEAGADIGASDPRGRTALHWALLRDSPAAVARLLELGADATARDDSGQVADPTGCERLNSATFFHNAPAQLVAACIGSGGDVTARSADGGGRLPSGSTPLHFAAAWAPDPAVIPLLVAAGPT